MASNPKRRCADTKLDNDFSEFPDYLIEELAKVLDSLCFDFSSRMVTLRPLKIVNCNAADGDAGFPFSEAYCYAVGTNTLVMLGEIFRRGVEIVTDFVKERKMPDNKQEHFVLCKFLHFINNPKDELVSFQDLGGLNETELTTLLVNHLFGKLSASSEYLIDENSLGKRKTDHCVCGTANCKLTGSFGDTSIGNDEVWHGNVNIIHNNDLVVEPVKENPENQVELKQPNLLRNAKIISETIVFSFLQKKRHPDKDHFLTPCIGVGNAELVIMFYDSEHDVLLESSCIPLIDSAVEGMCPEKLNLLTILVSWLVVNYKYLSSGLTEDMKSAYKADFFVQAKEKIEVYKENLKFQNVGVSHRSEVQRKDRILPSDFGFEIHQELSKVFYRSKKCSAE